MSKVKLGDVAKEHKEVLKRSKDGLPVVGLEHLIPNNIKLGHWDVNSENTFTKAFRSGNVLFGRRRAYLKKAAYAPFDGICSGDITVIEAIPNKILPELLPFIIQNDGFFDFAVGKSAGSLSPRVKWEHLKSFEFELPDDLIKQKHLAELLWSIVDTKESYGNLMEATDELVKSQFVEQFGPEAIKRNKWKLIPISAIVEKPMTGEWGEDDNDGSGVKVLRTTNFTDYGYIDYSEVVRRKIDEKKILQKKMIKGDILIEKSGGSDTKPVGRVVRFEESTETYLFNNFTAVLRCKSNLLNSRFLFTFLFINYLNSGTRKYENKTTGIHNLKLMDFLDNTCVPLVPIEIQNKFVSFVEQSDKAKRGLLNTLSELQKSYKKLISEYLG